jgi:hypothetical protein
MSFGVIEQTVDKIGPFICLTVHFPRPTTGRPRTAGTAWGLAGGFEDDRLEVPLFCPLNFL